MRPDRNDNRSGHRRGIRLTVGVLAGVAVVIYLGFISRGIFG